MYKDKLVLPPIYCKAIDRLTSQYIIKPNGEPMSSIASLMVLHDMDVKAYFNEHHYNVGWYIDCMLQWDKPERIARYLLMFERSLYNMSTLVGLLSPHKEDTSAIKIAYHVDMYIKKRNIANPFKYLD